MADFPSIAAAPTPNPANGQTGAIGGGLLRPGAIDQGAFQKLLQAQYRTQNQGKAATGPTGMTLSDYRKLAGIEMASGAAVPASAPVPQAPISQPNPVLAAPPGDGIPTLSLEQFAALTGMSLPETTPDQPSATLAGMGEPLPPDMASAADQVEAADMAAPELPLAENPAAPADIADGVPVLPDEADAAPTPAANSHIVLLDSVPDRDERRVMAAHGQTWRLKETPGARELFLGPDGEFGWDDFVDIINPLQHIPVVAQIYRAITGDQAYGLSAFMGALPFGPISVASAVIDTAIRAQTGRDAGTDLAARALGIDNRSPEEADLHLAHDGQDQLAAAGAAGEAAGTQVADASSVQPVAASYASARDMAGLGHD